MKYFEKAVRNYSKYMKDYYDRRLKDDIMRFNKRVEKMTADGECPRDIECRFCPWRLAVDAGAAHGELCGDPKERREGIAREVEE